MEGSEEAAANDSGEESWFEDILRKILERNATERDTYSDVVNQAHTLWRKNINLLDFQSGVSASMQALQHEALRLQNIQNKTGEGDNSNQDGSNTSKVINEMSNKLLIIQADIHENFKQHNLEISIKEDLNIIIRNLEKNMAELEEEKEMVEGQLDHAKDNILLLENTLSLSKHDVYLIQQELDSARQLRSNAENKCNQLEIENARLIKDLLEQNSHAASELNSMNDLVERLQNQNITLNKKASASPNSKSIIGTASSFFQGLGGVLTGNTGSTTSSLTSTTALPSPSPPESDNGNCNCNVNVHGTAKAKTKDRGSYIGIAACLPSQVKLGFQAHLHEITDICMDTGVGDIFTDTITSSTTNTTTNVGNSGSGTLITGGADSCIKIWNNKNKLWKASNEIYSYETGSPVMSVTIADIHVRGSIGNFQMICAGMANGTCNIYRVNINSNSGGSRSCGSMYAQITMPPHKVHACAILQNGSLVCTGGSDRTLRLWRLPNSPTTTNTSTSTSTSTVHAENIATIKTGSCINAICISLNETHIYTGHSDNSMRIYNYNDTSTNNSLECIKTLSNLHTNSITCIRQHPYDENTLLTSSKDNKLLLINVNVNVNINPSSTAGKGIITLRNKNLIIGNMSESSNIIAFSYDGKYIAAGSSNGSICIFDSITGNLQAHLAPCNIGRGITSIQWGNVGLVSADKSGRIVLWQ